MLTAIDLFCGAGGMTLGLTRAGFKIVGAVDSWKPAVETYRRNFTFPLMEADTRNIHEGEICNFIGSNTVDLLAGCPPCQGFSIQFDDAGKDKTPYSLFEFVRLIDCLSPRMFLIANVPVFFGIRGREFTEEFVEILKMRGYSVNWRKINAAEYGVPQIRKRLYYYGWRTGRVPDFLFPQPDHTPERFSTVQEAIGDLPSPSTARSELQSDPLHRRINTSELNLKRLKYVRVGGGFEDIPQELRPNRRQYSGYRVGHHDVYGRLHPDKPAGAIITGFDSFTRGRFGHPHENRNITLREGARLQTFPDDFIFDGNQRDITKLIGSAAPPMLVEKIGIAIASHLCEDYKSSSLMEQYTSPVELKQSSSRKRVNQITSEHILNKNKNTQADIEVRHQFTEPEKAVKSQKSLLRKGEKGKRKHRPLPLLEDARNNLITDSAKENGSDSAVVVKSVQVERNTECTPSPTSTSASARQHLEISATESETSPLLRVFLCHSSKDKPVVRTLYYRLRDDGVAPWLDEEDLLPGQNWQQEILKAVQSSDVVIVCLSQDSINKKGYLQKEIKYALDVAGEQPEGTIFLIPLRLEDCEVPATLRIWQWVNLFEDQGYEKLMRALRVRASTL